MSKQYAHLYTMAKTSVKFENDWPKTVGGVAPTRHPLTIRVLGKKRLSSQSGKSWKKKNLRIISKQYAHLHAMAKTSVKFQNDWPKTVGGVALTSQLLTNGQTDGSRHAYSTATTAYLVHTVCKGIIRKTSAICHPLNLPREWQKVNP